MGWGLPLCQNSSVTLGNDQSSPWDPLPYNQSTGQKLLSHAARAPHGSYRIPHTHIYVHALLHATPLLLCAFYPCNSLLFFLYMALCICLLFQLLHFSVLCLMCHHSSPASPQLTCLAVTLHFSGASLAGSQCLSLN